MNRVIELLLSTSFGDTLTEIPKTSKGVKNESRSPFLDSFKTLFFDFKLSGPKD